MTARLPKHQKTGKRTDTGIFSHVGNISLFLYAIFIPVKSHMSLKLIIKPTGWGKKHTIQISKQKPVQESKIHKACRGWMLVKGCLDSSISRGSLKAAQRDQSGRSGQPWHGAGTATRGNTVCPWLPLGI